MDRTPPEDGPPEPSRPNRGALGNDPFEESESPDQLLDRFEVLKARRPARTPDRPSVIPRVRRAVKALVPDAKGSSRSRSKPAAGRHRPPRTTPRLREIEPPDPANLLERLLSDDDRRRLSALEHLVEEEMPYDSLGFSPSVARTAFPFFYALYRFYFRVRSEGHDQIPVEGPAILAGNHAGLLPLDGAMTVVDVLLHSDPPRLPRAIVEHWAGTLPWINIFFARIGQVVGTRENFSDLLDSRQLVLVYPEGIDGIRKLASQRYRLQKFRMGFVEEALRARAPIIPVATIGSDDQAPILYDLRFIARRIGLPVFPITPTFPWLGPLGLLPYPVRYRIVYGEPLDFHERYSAEEAKDPRLVRYLANQVRRAIQQLVDRGR
jgi:1-acyl-sn-glycerol-3-phosphate acyltransferase